MTGDLPGRLDDLAVGEALAVAQIEGGGGIALFQIVQRQQVSIDQILHMDIIPHAGAVPGGIVGAVKGETLPLALGDLKNDGDQMGLGPVILPDGSVMPGTRHIKVAQRAEFEAVGLGRTTGAYAPR